MARINLTLGAAVDAVLRPFESLPPIIGLGAMSLAVAIAMLLVIRRTSNQGAIAAIKRRIQAGIFEIRLFNADVRALHAMSDVLRHNVTYLWLSLAPLPWMIVPLTLLVAQLQFYYAYDGFIPGQSTIVKVRLSASGVPAGGAPNVGLEAPPGVTEQTPRIWIPSEREAAWRIGFVDAGDYHLRVTVDGTTITKSVRVSNEVGRRSPGRFREALLTQVLYPAEPPIPAAMPIEAIELQYPERDLRVFGIAVNWLVAFIAMSFLFVWLLQARFSVEL